MRYFLVIDKRGNIDEYVGLVINNREIYKGKITCVSGDSKITLVCEVLRDLFDNFGGGFYYV